ncbi:MAG: endonuclease domain-containing protein [Actinomycetota bacterium]|nr:endonuclease domain-containing protein [Actinomycetota bacterium]
MSNRTEVEKALRLWLRTHHGVIGRSEALRLGATIALIRSKLDRGEWIRVHYGVYRDAATAVSHYQELRAAYVATDGLAVASHASAAWLWDLLPQPPRCPELTVPASSQRGRRIPALIIHSSVDLDWTRAVTRRAIRVTDPLRTLVDLGASVATDDLRKAVDVALATRLVNVDGLRAELTRLSRSGRPGPGWLRGLLADRGFVGAPHPSVLEARMAALIVRNHLPKPVVELRFGADGEYRLDYAYEPVKLAIEVDGYVWHSSPEQLQRDHQRRNQLQGNGWLVLVYTWLDVVREPDRVGREIATNWQQRASMVTAGRPR